MKLANKLTTALVVLLALPGAMGECRAAVDAGTLSERIGNFGTSSRNVTGLPAISAVNAVRTSNMGNWASLPAIPVSGSKLTATLPHRSAMTFPVALAAVDPPYGLYLRGGNHFTNFRGQQEKYFGGTSSLNGYNDPEGYWYYILPNGDLYEYTPPYASPALTGVLVAQLGTAYYENPQWLTYSLFQRDGSYFANFRGQQEKYLGGSTSANGFNEPDSPWYYILLNGELYEFIPPYSNPSLAGVLLARLGTAYYDHPSLLPVKLHRRGGSYFTDYRGHQEKYLGGLVSSSGYEEPDGYWYYILPNGDFYEFTPPYSNPALTGVLVEQLGPALYNDPSPLFTNGVQLPSARGVSGTVSADGTAKANARVTLFTADLAYFREVRSDASGSYTISSVPAGSYRLGVAARNFDYQEIDVSIGGANPTHDFALAQETHPGVWTVSGNIFPELLEGTGSGIILPTGEVLFCHDTVDPVCIDPATGVKWFPPSSGTPQGCHILTLLTSGDAYYAGGSMTGNPQNTVTQVSEYYRRTTNAWTRLANMNLGRWYPGLVRLPDERLLLIGGEVPPDGINRTNTCEIYNPATNTYTNTGAFNLPTEIPPALLLKNGTVFKTWRYPEFYDIAAGTWSAAPNMLQARRGAPGGDHCDHEIVYLPDGRVMAIGIDPAAGVLDPTMVEFYDPTENTWTLGRTPRHQRRRPETVLLPDGRVLAWGGEYNGPPGAAPSLRNAGTVPNCTNVADLFDPATDSWRPLADANRWVHYHNVQVLLADGRVMNTGGAGAGATFGGDSSIEYFSPPYLFRGVRPKIEALSTMNLVPGGSVTMQVSRTAAVTQVVLLATRAATHWVDGGAQRYLALPFTQDGGNLVATLPDDNVDALAGWYLLTVLVDDIPSEARIVRITAGAEPETPSLSMVNKAATRSPSRRAISAPSR